MRTVICSPGRYDGFRAFDRSLRLMTWDVLELRRLVQVVIVRYQLAVEVPGQGHKLQIDRLTGELRGGRAGTFARPTFAHSRRR